MIMIHSCLGVSTPAGMALPYRLCCLGIYDSPFVNGFADQIYKCVFNFAKCEEYKPFSENVCCQTFSIELGSKYATGINCVPLR